MRNQASTDDQGRYRLVGLQPGRYYLAVHAQPWYAQHNALRSSDARSDVSPGFHAATEQNANLDVVYPLMYYPRETDVARAGAISLHPGERVTADFELQPVPSLHLRFPVRGTDLNQIPGMQVMQQIFGQSIPADSQIISRDTDSIEVAGIPPGHLVVRLDMNADPANVKGMRSMQQEIDATRDGTVNLTETSDGVVVSGKVEIAGTVGLPDSAGITLRSVETGSDYFANISKEGKNAFQIADVKPGSYNVFLGNIPDFYIDKVQAVGAAVSGNNVTIGTAPQVRLAVSIGQGLGRVDGVALRDAKPVAGVMIALIPNQPQNDPFQFRRDQSDSDGSFTLQEVPPGRYMLVAIENGWSQEWADPAVFKQWLSGGKAIQVASHEKYTVEIQVQ
jgi:hypothetical protein